MLLVTTDIERALDSLDHGFLSSILRKLGYDKIFITLIRILLTCVMNMFYFSCVINRGTTIQYFHLERNSCQDETISAYLFILTLETLIFPIKKTSQNKGKEIFEHCFLYAACAYGITFFLKDS